MKKSIEEIIAGKDFNINGYFIKYGRDNLDWIVITPDKRHLAKLNGISSDGKLIWERLDVTKFKEIKINSDYSVIEFSEIVGNEIKYYSIDDLKSKFIAVKYYLGSKVVIKYVDLNKYISDDGSIRGTSTGGLHAVIFDIKTPYIPYKYILMHSRVNRDRDAYIFNISSDGKISGRYAYVSSYMETEDILKKLLLLPDATLIDSYIANSLSHQSKNLQTFDSEDDEAIEKNLTFVSLDRFNHEAIDNLMEIVNKMVDIV